MNDKVINEENIIGVVTPGNRRAPFLSFAVGVSLPAFCRQADVSAGSCQTHLVLPYLKHFVLFS